MANTYTYTQNVSFGVNNAPTYSGSQAVSNASTTAPRQYQDLCLHNGTTTIDASGFVYTNLLAFGFTANVNATQTGTPTAGQLLTPSVVVHFVDALSGGSTDYTITLTAVAGVFPAVSFVSIPATIAHNAVSITVVGDTNVDVNVTGTILLSA